MLLRLVGFLQGSLDVGGHTEVRCTLRSGNISKRSVAPVSIRSTAPFIQLEEKGGRRRVRCRSTSGPGLGAQAGRRRRNERALLDAAAAVFVASGVDAPVRRSRPRPASAWEPSTGIPPVGQTSSSPFTGTRSRPAPKPGRRCWRAAPPLTPPSPSGSTCSSTSWSPSTGSLSPAIR